MTDGTQIKKLAAAAVTALSIAALVGLAGLAVALWLGAR